MTKLKSTDLLFEEGKQKFFDVFGEKPQLGSYAAGRVNLIGEHTDYNGGFVMPMAIPLYTTIVGKINSGSKRCKIFSTSTCPQESLIEFDLPIVCLEGLPKWAKYFLGVVLLYNAKFEGFSALVHSSVPLGGGLSSSASFEIATLKFLQQIAVEKPEMSLADMALLCQKAEHKYANVPCGIMDQFSCAFSKAHHAMLLDCRNLTYDFLPIDDPDVVILVANSNVRHELSNSAYSDRRKVCYESAAKLQKASLRDVTLEELKKNAALLTPLAFKRVKHVISEIARTQKAAEALKKHEFADFGRLMNESHASLRDDYEVSCEELDELQKIALSCSGVYGSRMTGGGFGGCTVTLVQKTGVQSLCDEIERKSLFSTLRTMKGELLEFISTFTDMRRAVQPNIKLVANYVDQLKTNFDDIITPRTSTSKLHVENSPLNLSLSNFPSKIKGLHELKDCVKDHALGSNFFQGIAKWSRFSILNEVMKGFRLGELTILTGPTGSGKTTVLSEYSLDLCLAGVSTLWCSLEVPTGKLLSWMMSQHSRTDFSLLPEETSHKRFDEIYEKMRRDLKRMYFFDQHGTVPVDELVKRSTFSTAFLCSLCLLHAENAIENLNACQKLDHVLVDNLQFMQGSSKHGSQFDKYMHQDMIFSEFRQLASKLNLHITLVVHPRKEMEGAELHANSLYGGVKASQEADNIFILQKVMKAWSDPPFTKYFQIHKNRSAGDLVLGNTIKMEFDSRTKCHTLRKVLNQSRPPAPRPFGTVPYNRP